MGHNVKSISHDTVLLIASSHHARQRTGIPLKLSDLELGSPKSKPPSQSKMEEEKAVAYYDELTRKGEGAARFKQGLGFSSNNEPAPSKGSALPSYSSFLSSFVKSSSPSQTSKFEKQAQLESIQNKLKKKPKDDSSSRVSERSSRESSGRHRSRSRERDKDRDRGRHHRRRSTSRSRERYRGRDRDRRRSRSRSKSRSLSPRRDRKSERRNRSRSLSPRGRRRSEKSRSNDVERERGGKERNESVDYSQLIPGFEKMASLLLIFSSSFYLTMNTFTHN